MIITKCQLLNEVDIACERNEKFFRENFLNTSTRTTVQNPINNNNNNINLADKTNSNNNMSERSYSNTNLTKRNIHTSRESTAASYLQLRQSSNIQPSNNNIQLQPPSPQNPYSAPLPTTPSEPITSTSTMETELNNIMLQKLKAHEANALHANILKQATDFRYANSHLRTDSALMENVRNAFLECVRSYYWTRVHKAIIDRHSFVARTLIASVDLGLETTHTPGLQVIFC